MGIEEKVTSYIDEHREDIVNFLGDFIGFPSVNSDKQRGGNELKVPRWIEKQIKSMGYHKKVDS